MQSKYVTVSNSTFHYLQFGTGTKLVFCFHGYGRDCNTFSFLEGKLGALYTFIALDMPYHGQTNWQAGQIFQPAFLIRILQQIRIEHNQSTQKFLLMGFSMGGRISLHIMQLLQAEIEKVILIAPDGFKINFWHWFCTYTSLGNAALRYISNHPALIFRLLKLAEKYRVITSSVASFVHFYVDDNNERLLLYQRWTSLRKFRLRLPALKRIIIRHQIPVRMLFGLTDKIIFASGGRKFRKGISQYVSVRVINESHYLLRKLHEGAIVQLFTD